MANRKDNAMKTISAVALFAAALCTSAFAAGPDPTGDRESIARACLTKAGLTEARTLQEYEAVRFSKPGYFYFGTKLWVSYGTDSAATLPCRQMVGAK